MACGRGGGGGEGVVVLCTRMGKHSSLRLLIYNFLFLF